MTVEGDVGRLLDAAIDRVGLERLHHPSRGPAVLADLVGGAGGDFQRASLGLEAACRVWSGSAMAAVDIASLDTALREVGVDAELAAWSAQAWAAAVNPRLAAAPVDDVAAGGPSPGTLVIEEPALNLVPILVVVLLVVVLIAALLLI